MPSGPVELPGNCATVVPGVMAVAGLRNVGTKVGYSSFGPAGERVSARGQLHQYHRRLPALDRHDHESRHDRRLAVNGGDTYTNETQRRMSARASRRRMVSGIAALMRSVNDNLTPAQLSARIEASAAAFPPAGSQPVCPTTDADNDNARVPPRANAAPAW